MSLVGSGRFLRIGPLVLVALCDRHICRHGEDLFPYRSRKLFPVRIFSIILLLLPFWRFSWTWLKSLLRDGLFLWCRGWLIIRLSWGRSGTLCTSSLQSLFKRFSKSLHQLCSVEGLVYVGYLGVIFLVLELNVFFELFTAVRARSQCKAVLLVMQLSKTSIVALDGGTMNWLNQVILAINTPGLLAAARNDRLVDITLVSLGCWLIEIAGWPGSWVHLVLVDGLIELLGLLLSQIRQLDVHGLGLLVPIFTLALLELLNPGCSLEHCRFKLILLALLKSLQISPNFDLNQVEVMFPILLVPAWTMPVAIVLVPR